MSTEPIQYTEGDDHFEALVARPDGEAPAPAVLVCHAWGGRGDFEDGKAKKLAELGYVGVSIDVYGIGKRGTDKESNQALMMPLIKDRARLRRRLAAAYQAARTLDGVDPERMGVMGFCFGGHCALEVARMGAKVRGAVSFHGLLNPAEDDTDPIAARVLVLTGAADPMVKPEAIGAFAQEMLDRKASYEIHAYAGAMHAFTNPQANDPDFGTVYDADADARSWETMKRFWSEVF